MSENFQAAEQLRSLDTIIFYISVCQGGVILQFLFSPNCIIFKWPRENRNRAYESVELFIQYLIKEVS